MIHTSANIRVRYAETDRMDIVYHSNYFVWFETARIKMLDQIGMPYREIEASGLFLPVLSISAEYLAPARFDDRLEVHIYMNSLPRARLIFDYEIRRNSELLAIGTSTHAFINKLGKCQRPPENIINALKNSMNKAGE